MGGCPLPPLSYEPSCFMPLCLVSTQSMVHVLLAAHLEVTAVVVIIDLEHIYINH